MQKILYFGLGKMGSGMTKRLIAKKYRVFAYDPSLINQKAARKNGVAVKNTPQELLQETGKNRVIWLMIPHRAVDGVIRSLLPHFKSGDTVIDGGNSPFWKAESREKLLKSLGVNFLDVGVSGGPAGALGGACLMIGGREKTYRKNRKLFHALANQGSFAYVGKSGAGHFVKMVHNGIEYGMMQSLAEGFAVMKKSKFNLKLEKVAWLYNQGSVIESRLVGWLEKAFIANGQALRGVSAKVGHSGEGEWTIQAAKKLGVKTSAIQSALVFRKKSGKQKTYTGQILSALRNQFGGHNFKK